MFTFNSYPYEWVIQGPLTWAIATLNFATLLVMMLLYVSIPLTKANLYPMMISITGVMSTLMGMTDYVAEKVRYPFSDLMELLVPFSRGTVCEGLKVLTNGVVQMDGYGWP